MNGESSTLALEARVDAGPSEYRFRTAGGVCSPDRFRTAELLLADVLWDAADRDGATGRRDVGAPVVDSALVPEANYGVVGTLAAPVLDRVAMTESSARAARLCEANAARHGVDAAVSLTAGVNALEPKEGVADLPRGDVGVSSTSGAGSATSFDAVAYAPKPYTPLDVGAQRLVDATSRLDRGGRVFVAAAERAGLARYERVLADRCDGGRVDCVAERDDVRVLRGVVCDAGSEESAAEHVSIREFSASVGGLEVALASVPGVFSATRLDDGTRLLAAAAEVEDGDRVLDLCCGYGALGAWAAQAADCSVCLSDDDRVATACAERTLRRNGVDGTVVTADGVTAVSDRAFDRVLCNPPTHATDRLLADLFEDVGGVLAPDGDLFVVHHADLDLRPQLRSFDDVATAETGEAHVVLRAA